MLVDMFRLLYLCSSPNPIKSSTVKGTERVTRVRVKIQSLVGKHEGKKTFGRPASRWEIILKWTLNKWGGDLNWIDLAHDKYKLPVAVNTTMGLFVIQNTGFFY